MKKIIDYFVDNSLIVNLMTFMLVVVGTLALLNLNKETFPNVEFDFLIVTVGYPGTSSEDSESLIGIPLERELKSIEGIEELNVLCSQTGVIASLKIDTSYELDAVLDDVKVAIDKLTDLPEDATDPLVTKISNKTRALMNVALYFAKEDNRASDAMALRQMAKKVQTELEKSSYVSEVDIAGLRDKAIYIEADQEKLNQYDLSLAQMVEILKQSQLTLTSGNITHEKRQYLVRTTYKSETEAEINKIVLKGSDFGPLTRVEDVARVIAGLKDAKRYNRYWGHDAMHLQVKANATTDVLDASAYIKKKVQELKVEHGFEYSIYGDLSFWVKRRLGVLSENSIQAIFLVTLSLILFMSVRVSIITALGAPFAFFAAFILMDIFGITVNLISMFGLIMVLGMLVDDSIIVAEQFYQNYEEGMSPREAAKKAAFETLAPVTATVITTMVAFGSLFFVEGIMGKFLWPIPTVVIIALLASWIECFLILPSHLKDFSGERGKKVERTHWYEPMKRFYQSSLEFCLRNYMKTLSLFTIMFMLSAYAITKMKFELFPSDDVTMVFFNIKGPVDATLERTHSELLKVEKVLLNEIKKEELKSMSFSSGFQTFEGGRSKSGDQYGSIYAELSMIYERERNNDEIFASVTQKINEVLSKDYKFSLRTISGGPPKGEPLSVEVSGDDIDQNLKVVQEIQRAVQNIPGVLTTEIDYELGKEQMLVQIDGDKARRFGLNHQMIGLELRTALEGTEVYNIADTSEDIEVILRLSPQGRSNVNLLDEIKVTNQQGQLIELKKIAKIIKRRGPFLIRRRNQSRTVTLTGSLDNNVITSKKLNAKLTQLIPPIINKYKNITYELTGEAQDTASSLASFMKGIIGSNLVIYLILVILFGGLLRPFIIMSAIPLALIGVVISFLILGLPIGFMALMGMLGLVGVVINDSIVLVTFMSRLIQEKGFSISVISEACGKRFRAVILTTMTTFIGLLPIAHSIKGDPFLKPMATSFAYGLLFSSLITLVFVPCLYLLVEKVFKRRAFDHL